MKKSCFVCPVIILFLLSACSTIQGVHAPEPTMTLKSLPEISTPTAKTEVEVTGNDNGTGEITGIVWHDKCFNSGEGEGSDAPKGCVSDGMQGWIANGIVEPDESGIRGVYVTLGKGLCPSEVTKATYTNDAGIYSFPDLPAGDYCIRIDQHGVENAGIVPPLMPGKWTLPIKDQQAISLTLVEGEKLEDVNYGWDYLNLPDTTEYLGTCANVATFQEDISYPPYVSVSGGNQFIKIWRIKNDGDCVWTPDYTMIYVGGDAMDNLSFVNFPQVTAPGESVDLAVEFTAPIYEGIYSSDWILKSDTEEIFGVGPVGSQTPLNLTIKVSPEILWDELGEPSWSDSFDDASNWVEYNDVFIRDHVENGSLVVESRKNYDTWLVTYPNLDDFQLEAIFTNGETCTGLDRYGLIIRTEIENEQTQSGYLFSFSCDGQFSIRKWDTEESTLKYILDWTYTSVINTGPGADNHMGIKADDYTLSLFANGILLGQVEDDDFYDGKFGVAVAGPNTSGFTVFVDKIAYWAIDNP
ncbi:MAG: hypothetical protein JXA19_06525 [Anaerolineales bacterium]|nr:hypothetical protein [Anaerolineales bacterium]